MKLIVPAYFYPGLMWDKMLSKSPAKIAYVIANPDSGPGKAEDSEYGNALYSCRLANVGVLGYVPTTYGKRAIKEVMSDVHRYSMWYQVDGIFLDEASADLSTLTYYQELYRHIPGKVILNHGMWAAEQFDKVADYRILFEGQAMVSDPVAERREGRIVHSCPQAKLKKVVETARRDGVELLYVTDDVMDNPYDRLPKYWDKLLEMI